MENTKFAVFFIRLKQQPGNLTRGALLIEAQRRLWCVSMPSELSGNVPHRGQSSALSG